MSNKKYRVLSPDNFAITSDGATFRSLKKAKEALSKWIENYRMQGFYSQTCYNGYVRRISIESLADYCDIVTIN